MTHWSQAAKTDALQRLADGHTLTDTTTRTGIPKNTLARWARDNHTDVVAQARSKTARAREALAADVDQRRAELAADLMADADRLRRQLFAPCVIRKPMAVSDGKDLGAHIEIVDVELDQPAFRDQQTILTAVAIAVDKAQLLSGQATERHEHSAPDRTPEQEQELAKVLTLVQGSAA